MYFIEFFGPLKERAWLSCHSIFRYKGIESFKIYAQDQVDRATSKAAKEKLAERFQLKVALNRRDQWEVAIEQADMYLKTSEAVHDVNSAHSKVEKSGRAANLAYSLARLSQLNEEKINAKNACFNQPKRKVRREFPILPVFSYNFNDLFLARSTAPRADATTTTTSATVYEEK